MVQMWITYLVGEEEDVLVVNHAICSMLALIKKYIPWRENNK